MAAIAFYHKQKTICHEVKCTDLTQAAVSHSSVSQRTATSITIETCRGSSFTERLNWLNSAFL